MISCDEFQRRIAALLDNEGTEEDELLTSMHLEGCAECRAFQEDVVSIRRAFRAITFPTLPAAMRQEVMREAAADSLGGKTPRPEKNVRRGPTRGKFRRLAWAGILIGLSLLALSGLLCLTLAREVAVLRSELEVAKRDAALARMEKQVEEAEERRQKERKEQKAISARHFRTAELMRQSDRSYSPRTSLFRGEGDNI